MFDQCPSGQYIDGAGSLRVAGQASPGDVIRHSVRGHGNYGSTGATKLPEIYRYPLPAHKLMPDLHSDVDTGGKMQCAMLFLWREKRPALPIPRRPHRHSHTQSLGGILAIASFARYNERVP